MKSTIIFPIVLVIAALVLLVYVSMNQPVPLQYPTDIRVVDSEGEVVMVVTSGGDVPEEEEAPGQDSVQERASQRSNPQPAGNTQPQGQIPANASETNYNPAQAETNY